MASTIQEFAKERGINFLYHFTRIENLPSILNAGLQTKNYLNLNKELFNVHYFSNDIHRFDQTDAVCATISFPNYKMFFGLRSRNADAEWVVIELHASILWQKECAFCVTNAADSIVTSVPLQIRKGLDAFKKMFDDFGDKKRNNLNIPDRYTTNPQAEVLVFNNIEPNLIRRVYFQKDESRVFFAGRYNSFECQLNNAVFKYRCDWEHWR